jgi:twitching motility protein PilJ
MEKVMTMKLPWPSKKSKSGKSGGALHTTLIMEGIRRISGGQPVDLPVIGRLTVDRQYAVAAGALIGSLVLGAGFLMHNTIQIGNKAEYIATATEMEMLSQRLAKAAQQAVQGNPDAFPQIKEGKAEYANNLKGLIEGNAETPASPASVQPLLESLSGQWAGIGKGIDLILAQQGTLEDLARSVQTINRDNIELLEYTEQAAALMNQSGYSGTALAMVNQQIMLTQRMAKNANALLSSDIIDTEVAFELGKDVQYFKNVLLGFLDGSDKLRISAVRDPEVRAKMTELLTLFEQFEKNANSVLNNLQPLVAAKRAGRDIFVGSDGLLEETRAIAEQYQALGSAGIWLAALFGLTAVGSLILLGLINANDVKRQAMVASDENKRNQDAILRLLNEMGDLAEGDLTVNATVTEDITGAIADSVNYTISELRTLVSNLNRAIKHVSSASQEAKSTSDELLAAANTQARQIEDTSQAVLEMSQSIQEVSASAQESSRVAARSLDTADRGRQAVDNTITGMNVLRERIQDTAKRIKRLGESSQEIGEIVELISDITEQTNVLALNAAIQAASAGEAGRGFAVVAQEVQRLAERSAQATKQIGALVKAIQTDTQDAVAAMESGTRGVVDGTRLADTAGQSLQDIEAVSKQLASLIETISAATQSQAESAARVARNMQEIRHITQKTTEGNERTAESIGQLSGLADELKASVSGFKL